MDAGAGVPRAGRARCSAPSCRSTTWCIKAVRARAAPDPRGNASFSEEAIIQLRTRPHRRRGRDRGRPRHAGRPRRRQEEASARSPPRCATSPDAPAIASSSRRRSPASTFSVSNLGMIGIEHFTAIINPPEGAILAVGNVRKRAGRQGRQDRRRQAMTVTMSCDHRVIDGALGAKLLQAIVAILEKPTRSRSSRAGSVAAPTTRPFARVRGVLLHGRTWLTSTISSSSVPDPAATSRRSAPRSSD